MDKRMLNRYVKYIKLYLNMKNKKYTIKSVTMTVNIRMCFHFKLSDVDIIPN